MDNNISVAKHNKKMMKKKKKNKNITDINILECESEKFDSLPQNQDPMSKDLDKLFEKVKAKVEALKAAATTNAGNIPFPDMSASTPDKASSLEKTIENGEQDSLPGLPIISQRAEVTADTDPPLVCNSVHKLEDIKELSSCKAILKEYADKINVENPNYKTEKADGSNLAFVSSLTFNGKQYVGEEGRNKKESQHLAARVVIQSILDSDARDVISKIIKSKEKIIFPAKPKVQNQCNTQTVCMPATLQTDNNVSTSSSKGNEIEVVVNDSMLKTATQEPCAGNSSGVSAKPVLLVEELSLCKAILKEFADKINVENPNYKTEKEDGSHLAFVSSLTFGGKQYVGDKGRNKKESQHLAAHAVILSILDSDAHDVISKIIKSKEKMFCSAKGTIHNPCSVQNVGVLVGIQTGCTNFGPSLSKGSELKLVVKDNMLKTASQYPYTENLSTVTANPVSLVEASSTPTLFVPSNSEQLVCGSTSSKKRKRKTKKAEHKVGVDGNGSWSFHPSNHALAIDFRQQASQVNLVHQDLVLWEGQKAVNISMIWNTSRRVATGPVWTPVVWHSLHIPKCSFILWLGLKNRLQTIDRLFAFGLLNDITCLLCNDQN